MSERLIPGVGYVDESGSAQRLIPGVGYVDETVSSGASGTSATTNAADTSAASGTTTVAGALATTNANDTSDASGVVGAEVTGTLATTNANDTSSASGTTAIVGTVAYVNANDIAAATGVADAITGTAACTNADDTCNASGSGAPSAQGGGGFYEVPQVRRHRSVQEERERLGIITKAVKKVLVAVAKASVASEATDTQAGGLLASALAMRGFQAAPQYEQFMQQERDRILSRDIERALRIRQRQYELDEDEREAEMLLM